MTKWIITFFPSSEKNLITKSSINQKKALWVAFLVAECLLWLPRDSLNVSVKILHEEEANNGFKTTYTVTTLESALIYQAIFQINVSIFRSLGKNRTFFPRYWRCSVFSTGVMFVYAQKKKTLLIVTKQFWSSVYCRNFKHVGILADINCFIFERPLVTLFSIFTLL